MNTVSLIELPYRVARAPFTVVDRQLMQRLSPDSSARLAFERFLGTADSLAGRVLSSATLSHRGTATRERAEMRLHANTLEHDAAERRATAAKTADTAAQRADALRANARRVQRDGVREAAASKRAAEKAATERARADAEAVKKDAKTRAAARVGQVAERQTRITKRVSARAAQTAAKTKSERSAAAATKARARGRRAQADELSTLATTKKTP
jgi:hypothetical protein